MLPTGSAKTALLPAILGDVNAGGGGAPIERENEGEMDHFVVIEKKKKKRQRKRKIRTGRKEKAKEEYRSSRLRAECLLTEEPRLAIRERFPKIRKTKLASLITDFANFRRKVTQIHYFQ